MSFIQSMMGLLMSQVSQEADTLYEIDGGTFTLNTDMTSGEMTISHDLGVAPSLVVVFSPTNANTSTTGVLAWALKIAGASGNYMRTGGNVNPRSRQTAHGITAYDSASFTIKADSSSSTAPMLIPANVPYYWIAVKVL